MLIIPESPLTYQFAAVEPDRQSSNLTHANVSFNEELDTIKQLRTANDLWLILLKPLKGVIVNQLSKEILGILKTQSEIRETLTMKQFVDAEPD